MALEDKVETGTLGWITVIGSVILLLVILAVETIFAIADRTMTERRVLDNPNTEIREYKAAQAASISEYAKDGDKDLIPIERAMQLVVEDNKPK